MSVELFRALIDVASSHGVQNEISYDFNFIRWLLHFEFPSYTSVH